MPVYAHSYSAENGLSQRIVAPDYVAGAGEHLSKPEPATPKQLESWFPGSTQTLAQRALLAYAADKRWRVETSGINVGGMSIHTDRESQAKINGALTAVQRDPDFTTDWKTADGWQTLDATTIVIVADSVLDHVKASYAAERAVSDAIAAGKIKSQADIDAFAWPANG